MATRRSTFCHRGVGLGAGGVSSSSGFCWGTEPGARMRITLAGVGMEPVCCAERFLRLAIGLPPGPGLGKKATTGRGSTQVIIAYRAGGCQSGDMGDLGGSGGTEGQKKAPERGMGCSGAGVVGRDCYRWGWLFGQLGAEGVGTVGEAVFDAVIPIENFLRQQLEHIHAVLLSGGDDEAILVTIE